jgi:hypothetical protein
VKLPTRSRTASTRAYESPNPGSDRRGDQGPETVEVLGHLGINTFHPELTNAAAHGGCIKNAGPREIGLGTDGRNTRSNPAVPLRLRLTTMCVAVVLRLLLLTKTRSRDHESLDVDVMAWATVELTSPPGVELVVPAPGVPDVDTVDGYPLDVPEAGQGVPELKSERVLGSKSVHRLDGARTGACQSQEGLGKSSASGYGGVSGIHLSSSRVGHSVEILI